MSEILSLSPAKWIWAPYGRTLPNTFVMFRKTFTADREIESAKGWVLACSRYVMSLNGERIQFGPAPCDPRHEEADPADLTGMLRRGKNTLGFRVLYYGHGDGTWVTGNAGLIFKLEIKYKDGTSDTVFSDKDTLYAPDEAHPAGMYKRWYLRALQEIFDSTKDIPDFDINDCREENRFRPSKELCGDPGRPSIMNGNTDYLYNSCPVNTEDDFIRPREIPMPSETHINAAFLSHSDTVIWYNDPDDWFRFRRENSFEILREPEVLCNGNGEYRFDMPETGAAALTFKMPECGCGFIEFNIEAPEGTVVEAITQEGHHPENTHWLDTQFHSWTRFVCREGKNHFISFDYECFAWLQLHIRNAAGRIVISGPGMLRRKAPVQETTFETDDDRINAVAAATLNTLANSAIETFVDGMGRERQQYSGDVHYQTELFAYLYGTDHPMVRRFYKVYSEGISKDGFFIDCWPAYDRMNRLAQYQLDLAPWAPILDHSLTFAHGYCKYRFESGDTSLDEEMLPRFIKLMDFLDGITEDGLVRTEDTGSTWVWLDPDSFSGQEEKVCAFNLQVIQTYEALSKLFKEYQDSTSAERCEKVVSTVRSRLFEKYYDQDRKIFTDSREKGTVSDRTLALSLMTGILPDNGPALNALREMPSWTRHSYPANAVWRLRALGEFGETEAIIEDIRTRWFSMESLGSVNTLQESWKVLGDAAEDWSHCPVGAYLSVIEGISGLKCEAPAFRQFSVKPVPGDLKHIEWNIRTPNGEIRFVYDRGYVTLYFPSQTRGFVVMKDGTRTEAGNGLAVKLIF